MASCHDECLGRQNHQIYFLARKHTLRIRNVDTCQVLRRTREQQSRGGETSRIGQWMKLNEIPPTGLPSCLERLDFFSRCATFEWLYSLRCGLANSDWNLIEEASVHGEEKRWTLMLKELGNDMHLVKQCTRYDMSSKRASNGKAEEAICLVGSQKGRVKERGTLIKRCTMLSSKDFAYKG